MVAAAEFITWCLKKNAFISGVRSDLYQSRHLNLVVEMTLSTSV